MEIPTTMVGTGKIKKSGQASGNDQGEQTSEGNKPGKEGNKPGGVGCGNQDILEIDPNAKVPLDCVSYEEQTQQAFKELLCLSERKTIRDTKTLDTDNLTSYFTGDIDTLFKDDKKIKIKKSKILFLLDSSGSMHHPLPFSPLVTRNIALANVVKNITKILDEVKDFEGINVDYDIRAFDTRYFPLSKDNWYNEYIQRGGGGTNASLAFTDASDELYKDKSIDGKKMIIFVTDGDVDINQIDNIKDRVIKNGSELRVMMLGIGMNAVHEQEFGAHNILAEELADGILMQAIEDMLD
jgi:hypothetical protein